MQADFLLLDDVEGTELLQCPFDQFVLVVESLLQVLIVLVGVLLSQIHEGCVESYFLLAASYFCS